MSSFDCRVWVRTFPGPMSRVFLTPAVGPVPYHYLPYTIHTYLPTSTYILPVHTNVHCPVCGPQPGWPSLSCSCQYQVGGRGQPGSQKTAAAVGDSCHSHTRRVPAPGTSILTAHCSREVGTLGTFNVGKQAVRTLKGIQWSPLAETAQAATELALRLVDDILRTYLSGQFGFSCLSVRAGHLDIASFMACLLSPTLPCGTDGVRGHRLSRSSVRAPGRPQQNTKDTPCLRAVACPTAISSGEKERYP